MAANLHPGVDFPSIADIVRRNTVLVPDFPQAPVIFVDVVSIFANAKANDLACRAMSALYDSNDYDVIVGLESRGWPFAQSMSLALGKPWYPIRKPGKLPRAVVRQEYACEYGTGVLELHADDIASGSRVLIVDDLIATGGSALATVKLLQQVGAQAIGVATLYSLDYLLDPAVAATCALRSVVHYASADELQPSN